jgi:5-formyltetrahydrofolate cyclo-ligase
MPGLDSKKILRQQYRQQRERLSGDLAAVSADICGHLRAFIASAGYQTVLAYRAFGSEPVLDYLITALPGIHWLCTRIESSRGQPMLTLHAWDAPTERHRWGLVQPIASAEPIALSLVDAVLVPGLAFGVAGERLGYGGGFYDRLLAQLHPNVARIGISRRALIVADIPMLGFDVSMTYLATEAGVFTINLPS